MSPAACGSAGSRLVLDRPGSGYDDGCGVPEVCLARELQRCTGICGGSWASASSAPGFPLIRRWDTNRQQLNIIPLKAAFWVNLSELQSANYAAEERARLIDDAATGDQLPADPDYGGILSAMYRSRADASAADEAFFDVVNQELARRTPRPRTARLQRTRSQAVQPMDNRPQ